MLSTEYDFKQQLEAWMENVEEKSESKARQKASSSIFGDIASDTDDDENVFTSQTAQFRLPVSENNQIKTMIVENNDETLVEARSLLSSWVNSPSRFMPDSDTIRKMVAPEQAADSGPSRAVPPPARRVGGGGFREHSAAPAAFRKEERVYTFDEVKRRVEAEKRKEMERIRKVDQQREQRRQRMLEQMEELDRLHHERKPVVVEVVVEAEPVVDDAREELLRNARDQANVRFELKQVQRKKIAFKAWLLLATSYKPVLKKYTAIKDWKGLNTLFQTWRKSVKSHIQRRELKEQQYSMRIELEKNAKSAKLWRRTALSKAFTNWRTFTLLQAEERKFTEMHHERTRRMHEFLAAMQDKMKAEEERKTEAMEKRIAPPVDASNASQPSTQPAVKTEAATPAPAKRVHKAKPVTRSKSDIEMLKRMEEREMQRKERMRIVEEKKREKQELEEKLEQELREKQIEEEKRVKEVRKQELLEKKRLEEQEKQQRKEHFQSLLKIANAHYTEKYLPRYYGVGALKRYLTRVADDTRAANAAYRASVQKRLFSTWTRCVAAIYEDQERTAIKLHDKNVCSRFFERIKTARSNRKAVTRYAAKQHDMRVKLHAMGVIKREFRAQFIERMQRDKKQNALADAFFRERYMPRKFVRVWRAAVVVQREEQWRESRRRLLRDKVQEILQESRLEESFARESVADY